jgi:hypothetical protein
MSHSRSLAAAALSVYDGQPAGAALVSPDGLSQWDASPDAPNCWHRSFPIRRRP